MVFGVNPFEERESQDISEERIDDLPRLFTGSPRSKVNEKMKIGQPISTKASTKVNNSWKNFTNIELVYGIHSQPDNFSNRLAMRQSFLGRLTQSLEDLGGRFKAGLIILMSRYSEHLASV